MRTYSLLQAEINEYLRGYKILIQLIVGSHLKITESIYKPIYIIPTILASLNRQNQSSIFWIL